MNTVKNTLVSLMLIIAFSMPVYSDVIQEGKKLAFDRKKGNCLACHMIDDGELAGNSGPPMIAMKARFPDREVLFNQIWATTKNKPNTFMPPFGKHGALTKD